MKSLLETASPLPLTPPFPLSNTQLLSYVSLIPSSHHLNLVLGTPTQPNITPLVWCHFCLAIFSPLCPPNLPPLWCTVTILFDATAMAQNSLVPGWSHRVSDSYLIMWRTTLGGVVLEGRPDHPGGDRWFISRAVWALSVRQ